MSFSLVALKILVPAVAKTLLDAAGIESTLTKKVLEQGFDAAANGIPDWGNRRKLEQKIGQIAGELQTQIRPLFEQEARNLAANSREAVLLGVAETLFKGGLSPDALVGMNLDTQQLYQHLLKANPKISRDFSRDEKALYEQALLVASQSLIEAAPKLEEFSLSFAATTLQRLDEVLNDLKTQREQALQAADEFVERYCKTVISELDRLEVFGLPRMDKLTHKQSLSMAYITLSVSGDDEPDCSPVTLIDDVGVGREAVNRSRRVDEVICNCRRLVIRGGAGAGKSTLLQWLAVRAASRNFPEKLQHWNYKIPFFIRLRSLVDGGFPTPEEFPKLIARNFAATMPQGWAHKYLDRGHALVLIDGVDELPSQQRQAFFEALQDLVRDFSDATYIVTSRPSGLKSLQGEEWEDWEDWVKNENFKNLTLEPMSSTNVEEFVSRWHRALNSNSSSNTQQDDPMQIADNLKRQLRQRAELRRLASTPLLCAMICALHRERREALPSARLQLYRECIDMLLNRRDEGRKIPLDETYPTGLNEDQKMAFIQSLAFWFMKNNRSDIEIDRVDTHFDRRLKLMSLPQAVTGEQIRSLFVDRSGLLREPVMGQIDFAHRTFQEYLAAKAAVEDYSLDLLLQRATDDQWREAIIAAAGLGRATEKEKLLKALIEKGNTDPDKKHYLHLLAVACLETVVEVDPTIRQEVLDNAKVLLPPKDEDEIAMVARAGDAIVPLLEYEPQFSAEEACNCIAALTRIGSSTAMQKLVAYAEAKFDLQKDESRLSRVLGRGWDYFDRDVYVRDVLSLLKTLDLSETQVQDITALTALSELRTLSLSETQVQDITALTALSELRTLSLSETQVQDITALTALSELRTLALSGTQVQDITALTAL
ncbi:NACHT domain-containing protein, partial [Coleofasciculus sp. FACHB-SPT36]|uniref:NACHT domain-containing protein n=2 Tax=Cyanophyceae TaxID=3028117 RepID=UPI00168B1C76